MKRSLPWRPLLAGCLVLCASLSQTLPVACAVEPAADTRASTADRVPSRSGRMRFERDEESTSPSPSVRLASGLEEPVPPPIPDSFSSERFPASTQNGEVVAEELIVSSQPVSDQSLTLAELEELAEQGNPTLAEAAARVDALRGKWVQVGLPPNTVLGYSGQQLGSGGEAEQQGMVIGQQFVRGGKLRLNRAVASQEVRKAETQFAAQRQRVLTDVRLAYYEVLIAQRRLQVARELASIADQAVKTAEALLGAREVSQVDVMRARVEWQSAELLLKNAENQKSAAWQRLAAVVGTPGLENRELVGDLEESLRSVDPDEIRARLLADSPQVAAAELEVERARWQLRRQRAEPIPNVDVEAVGQTDNATNSANANLVVTMPLPWLDRNQGAIRQAYSDLLAAERATGRVRLSLQKQLATVFQAYANARNQVEDYSKANGILENSRSTLEFVQKGYRAGEIGYLDLLTAQRTYAETNLAYLDSLGSLRAALVELEGLLLRDSLEEDRSGVSVPD